MTQDKSKSDRAYKIIGENVRKIRKQRKISQEFLAFEIESNRNYIGYIERGERRASLATIYNISRALNVKFVDLFKNID